MLKNALIKKEVQTIGNQELEIKVFNGQRVVTFKDIDLVHERAEGTAGRNFRENKDKFIVNEDYFYLTGNELRQLKQTTNFVGSNAKEFILLTEQGYLMLVKSFTDDLAWKVQRQLVNNYFKGTKQENNQSAQPKPQVDTKAKEIEARLINARVREANMYLKIASAVNIPTYQQVMYSKATEALNGEALLPLPKAERKTYSAGEIGERLGITANKVGALANKHKLKTREYGLMVWDKSKYSNKQVETWRYYDNVIPILEEILNRERE